MGGCVCIYVIRACWQLQQLKTTRYQLTGRETSWQGIGVQYINKNGSQSQFGFCVWEKPAPKKQVPFCKVSVQM